MARDLVQQIPDVAMHVANAVKRNPSAISADGSRIASSSQACTIRLWDAEAGQALGRPLLGHIKCVQGVAFSPYDDSRIISGSQDFRIRLWDATTGQSVGEPRRGYRAAVQAVAFSPDSSRVVSGSQGRTIRLRDAEIGQTLGVPLREHTNWVLAVAFSPDGSQIVSGSTDRTIQVWNVELSESLGPVQPLGPVYSFRVALPGQGDLELAVHFIIPNPRGSPRTLKIA
ncbi:SubName: Full=Related to WD40-repeat protein (Notchless protein) {ECO:0000313/EMBL:CCA75740.1} [Serendipita indica DSM 11827]|nr:SubName: Full=Related to WD40-repeat protein (Notchless protein) {ECO:0000313/EMBL:CCA75740.1} [Serendipita indica DSM 11827]